MPVRTLLVAVATDRELSWRWGGQVPSGDPVASRRGLRAKRCARAPGHPPCQSITSPITSAGAAAERAAVPTGCSTCLTNRMEEPVLLRPAGPERGGSRVRHGPARFQLPTGDPCQPQRELRISRSRVPGAGWRVPGGISARTATGAQGGRTTLVVVVEANPGGLAALLEPKLAGVAAVVETAPSCHTLGMGSLDGNTTQP